MFSFQIRFRTILLALIFVLPFIQGCQNAAKVEGLRTEHLSCPLGIDSPAPRFSWMMEDARKGACQRSYRILVGEDESSVEKGEGLLWDSGKVVSDDCLVTYAGKLLAPFTRYWWKVVVEDMKGKPLSSATTFFETGTMGNWSPDGAWIDDGKDIAHQPAPYFRKEFNVDKKLVSARAYIASAGLNVLYVNGKRIGDRYLDPAFTRFDESILYTIWDITDEIKEGTNALGVLLGNGWYNHQPVAAWSFHTAYWRARPAFRMDIRLTFADGETVTIPTDTSWKASSDGPLIFDNIYTGERYDARLEMDGWNEPGFDDRAWEAACRRASPTRKLVAQAMTPIRASVEYKTVSLNKINDTCWVYDFGQNMSGNVSAHIRGKAGVGVALRYGERLYPDGHVDQHNISHLHWGDKKVDPFMTDSLYLGDNGVDFTPEFSYKGFRYVQVNTTEPLSLDENSLTALFIHTDFDQAGCLEASNPLIENLDRAAVMSYLSNYMGYPTDCPQREKNGWTGDAHIAVETGLYHFDAFTAYEKWMADHRENQLPNGVLPDIIPTWGWGLGGGEAHGANGLDWTSTIALIPWELYLFYGDEKPLRDCYDNIKRYVDFATAHTENLLSYWGRGDWVPVTKKSNPWVIYSTFHFVDCKILSQAATLFGKEEDARYYAELAERVRKAINDKFLDPATGIYADGMQTSQSFPLFWGVTPDSLRAKVAGKLAEMVRNNGYHIDAGVHGAKAVPNALAMNGFVDEAYQVAVQEGYPSWGWWIVNGRTTFLENWELDTDIYSDNHIMFGDIAAWFYRWIGGIQPDPEQPGFKRTILRPGFPEGLDHFRCSHASPYGTIVSGWERSGEKIRYKVTVPANTAALLYLPDREEAICLPAGTHEFKFAAPKKAVRLTAYVDPFIGTASTGHTHPAATLPFGMVQAGPDNLCPNGNWNYCSGYNSESDYIIGFSHTHLSGTGASDMGDILLLPVTGEVPIEVPAMDLTPNNDPLRHLQSAKGITNYKGYGSYISHARESAAAGYYGVTLDDYGIGAQITVTPRTAYHRYTFPACDQSGVLIDLESGTGDHVSSGFLTVEDDHTVVGMRRSYGFVYDHWYYFVAKFSKPIESVVSFVDGEKGELRDMKGTVVKALLGFKTGEGETVDVKVALSTTGIEGARKNLEAENPGWDFEAVRAKADATWERYLSRVEMKDPDIHKMRGFYTSLYHCLLMPNLVSDVDGAYEGWDHEIHPGDGSAKYTNFSLWDTYRAEHPFLNLLYPEINSDLVKSMLEKYRQTGLLVTNEYGLCETWCMIGNHAVNPIVDAFLKGDTSFDPEFAYEAVRHSMTADHNKSDWTRYDQYGYFPYDLSDVESVSRLMEACYDDYCVAKMAEKLGKKEDAAFFLERSYNFRHLFDPETGFSRAKDSKGAFRPNFSPYDIDLPGQWGIRDYTEGNAWQWTWHVQHDFEALAGLFPSRDAFMSKFDSLFTNTGSLSNAATSPDVTGLIGMYAHGNEPSHHMAYLYTLAGKPERTAEIVREIIDNFYPDTREGLCGNDDCGQMSAWYLFSAFGFYPVDPVSGRYVFGAPQVPWVRLALPNGKTLTIQAEGLSETAKYVKSISFNGKVLEYKDISYDLIMKGGELVYEMTDQAQTILDRPVVLKDGVIQPWLDYDSLFIYSMNFLKDCGTLETPQGPKPAYLVTSKFNEDGTYPEGHNRNNQGGNAYFGMRLFRSYYPYFGDREALRPVKDLLDRMMDFPTPEDWAWPGMIRTQDNDNPDGIYLDERIETDKAAMVASACLDYARFTGETRYETLALHIASLLLSHTGEGNAETSPLPFRINMRTGEVEDPYTSDMIFVVELYDRLLAMDCGMDKGEIQAKRDAVLRWIQAYPMKNGRWSGYFEDVERNYTNLNQFSPLETARYFLDHPEADPQWKQDVFDLLAFVKGRFGEMVRFGGTSICEQDVCFLEMSSHTARYASVLARWAGETGSEEAKNEALASFALAEYSAYNKYSKGEKAINSTGLGYPKCWFSDSYFDYLPHYFEGMAAWPEMIPEGRDHLFQSSSMILDVRYAPGSVRYTAADKDGTERLKLSFRPKVYAGGKPLPKSQWSFGRWRDCEGILTIHRKGVTEIEIVK